MSRLREMIKELCPDGVEYRKLEDVLKICNGSDYKKFGEGDIPVYGSGGIMTYIDTYVYDKPSVLIPRKGSLDKLYYVDVPFWTVDTIFYTKISEDVLPKYVFYYLQSQHLERLNKAGGVPSLTQTILNKVLIPIPPLPIQNEIVKMSDNFTELTAELTAELLLRKKQYNFYRDSLLDFVRVDDTIVQTALRIGKIGLSNELIELQRFDKYCTYVRGVTYNKMQEAKKEDCATWKVLRANNITLETNTINTDDVKLIKKDVQVKEEQLLKEGDILICAGSGSRSHIGKVAYIERDMNYTFGGFMAVIRCDDCVNKRYLFHVLRSCLFSSYLDRTLNSSTINNLNYSVMKGFEFPMPSITLQNKIVSILDRFDALCHDLTQGLPAEIAARKKQYEYYRDKLLTFPRKNT